MESTSRIFKLVRSQRTETFLSFYTVGHFSTEAVSVWRIAFDQVQKVSTILITEKNIRNPRIHVSENYNILIYYESGYLKFKLSTEGILSLESSYQGGKGWPWQFLRKMLYFIIQTIMIIRNIRAKNNFACMTFYHTKKISL